MASEAFLLSYCVNECKKDVTQIVLRNDEGVFVLTPSQNKSFRFQSNWPDNQGQVYLYETLIRSITGIQPVSLRMRRRAMFLM